MWRIESGLFVSTDSDAANLDLLQAIPMTHVVNCALELPNHFSYLRLDLEDPDTGLIDCLDDVCQFIDKHIADGKVLVHCHGAVSRSPSVVLAYLCHKGQTLVQAAESVAAILPTCPNIIFLEQICQHFGFSLNEDELLQIATILRQD